MTSLRIMYSWLSIDGCSGSGFFSFTSATTSVTIFFDEAVHRSAQVAGEFIVHSLRRGLYLMSSFHAFLFYGRIVRITALFWGKGM